VGLCPLQIIQNPRTLVVALAKPHVSMSDHPALLEALHVDIVEVSSSEEAITTHQPDDGLALGEISKVHIDQGNVKEAEVMERVSEWIMDPLDDVPMKTMGQLEELVMESLQSAQKNKIYCYKSLFAALIDFYHWALRYGQGKAAMHVTRNYQCGPAFARRVCFQARYFEAHGMLEVSC
jgi:hypothetical protein